MDNNIKIMEVLKKFGIKQVKENEGHYEFIYKGWRFNAIYCDIVDDRSINKWFVCFSNKDSKLLSDEERDWIYSISLDIESELNKEI